MNRGWLAVYVAALATVPGVLTTLGFIGGSDPVRAAIYGVAIVAAAFLLSWAAEA